MMYRHFNPGLIEVITGPMFAGKSEELIKRIKTLGYANVKTLVVKPSIDNRWEEKRIVSRAGISIETFIAKTSNDIRNKWNDDFKAIAIDEAQFFDNGIVDLIKEFADNGTRVIVSCLDMDFKGQPFGSTPYILAIADFVTKLKAVCFKCGAAASLTKRLTNQSSTIVIGDNEYEARCRQCHQKP